VNEAKEKRYKKNHMMKNREKEMEGEIY